MKRFLRHFEVFIPETDKPKRIHLPRNLEQDWISTFPDLDLPKTIQLEEDKQEILHKKEVHLLQLLKSKTLNLDELRMECATGIPQEMRAFAWKLLLGYWPVDAAQRSVQSQREVYQHILAHFKYNPKVEHTRKNKATLQQIKVDLPRTNPNGYSALFQHDRIQLLMENVLYVWAIKNPETDYFQGLNDLLVPFILVHLAGYVGGDLERINVEFLTADMFDAVEADCFWCLDSFMRKLHLHFNITTPGINRMVDTLADYVRIVDEPLYRHFQKEKVEFTFFAIRWMICLLTREMHLDKMIKIWDIYMAKSAEEMVNFHLCICAAFLIRWSPQLMRLDFSNCMMYLQKIYAAETHSWTDDDISALMDRAYEVRAITNYYNFFLESCTVIVLLLVILALVLILHALHTKQQMKAEQKQKLLNQKDT
eukprot:TRINITY_DN17955_c0_g1_i1.p1 TRINITY_DN17955_c0_g1~~TRINITY_DN17955_c0_g1_i1.p1  ORF type:complete len:466 (+),score=81.85 TRINITY_DN17955_c0_g1_i1:127-1398(+)